MRPILLLLAMTSAGGLQLAGIGGFYQPASLTQHQIDAKGSSAPAQPALKPSPSATGSAAANGLAQGAPVKPRHELTPELREFRKTAIRFNSRATG
jgi:hypothetical protein